MSELQKPESIEEQKVPTEDIKSIKKLIESFVQVYRLQNGKDPSRHDIAEFLKSGGQEEGSELSKDEPEENTDEPADQQEATSEVDVPEILNFLAYYGKDPESPLYYSHDQANIHFNVDADSHEKERPAILNSLSSRPIQQGDLVSLLASGLMTDLDYVALKGRGLIHKDCEKAHDLMMKMRGKVSDLSEATKSLNKSLSGIHEEETPR